MDTQKLSEDIKRGMDSVEKCHSFLVASEMASIIRQLIDIIKAQHEALENIGQWDIRNGMLINPAMLELMASWPRLARGTLALSQPSVGVEELAEVMKRWRTKNKGGKPEKWELDLAQAILAKYNVTVKG